MNALGYKRLTIVLGILPLLSSALVCVAFGGLLLSRSRSTRVNR